MWAHSLTGAADLVTYRTMPTQELRGGNPDAYDSQKAKDIARRIYDAYKQQDENNGTNYSSSLSTRIYESDDDMWVKARRQLIERAATFEQAPPPCASRFGGGERRVQFAEGRDVRDFFEDAPVALSGGSSSSSLMPLVRGVMVEAVAPVIFAAGASNCKSNPGFPWTPGGSNGPDGMGYCPHDYEPGTVLPGFDGGLYKVAVGRDGSRVWTSAGDAPVTYRIVQRPQGADGMGLLDGAGLGDYDTYSWPAHVPQSWASYGYRRNCNAYSFLPSHMHHSILRYLVDGRLDRSKATSTGGVGEDEAKVLIDRFGTDDALALVSTGTSVTFNKTYAYLGKLSAEDPPSGASGSTGGTSGSASSSASGSASTPLSKVYVPNGTGILATDKVLFVGTFTKAAQWGEFQGGAESFKGWKLQVDGDKVVATFGTGVDGTFTAAADRKLEMTKADKLQKGALKGDGIVVDETAQSAYCAGDASGYAFELRRQPAGTDHVIWLRIGKGTTGKSAVQEGWICKVAGTAADGLAMKFKLDGKGQTQVTHLYAGLVDAFGMPTKLGVLQQLHADLATTEQRGEFRLGQLVLGSCGVKQHGFFLDGKLYGDAKFQGAAFNKAQEKSAAAKKHVDGNKDELKKQLGEFSAVVNPVQLDLKGGASKVPVRGTPVRDAPVPQDDLPIFGVAPATYLDVKGGMHGALHKLPSVPSSAHMPAHTLAMHPPVTPAMPAMSSLQTKPAVPSASSILGPELRKGQVDVEISTRVQKAQEQLRDMNSKGADARLVDELKGYADLLFRKGEQFVNLEDGLPARASGLSAAEEEKRKAELARVLQEVIKPCQTLVQHRDSKHAWTRQYVHMLSLKILALVKYICSSERTGVSELCKLRESVEQCLAFALK
jgi:hypothetical protein